jgi:hypothetical protein
MYCSDVSRCAKASKEKPLSTLLCHLSIVVCRPEADSASEDQKGYMTTMNITIVAEESGQSESIPVTADTSVKDLAEWTAALLGIDDPVLFKDGRPIAVIDPTTTLQAAGIVDGDLLVVVSGHSIQRRSQRQQPDPPAVAAGGTGGGLDFSALLANAGTAATTTTATVVPKPVYYDGMSLHEAQSYNPHPQALCTVLYEHEHLRKELNYYQPKLVADMFPSGAILNSNDKVPVVEHAAKIWRDTMIKVTSKQRHRGEVAVVSSNKEVTFPFS